MKTPLILIACLLASLTPLFAQEPTSKKQEPLPIVPPEFAVTLFAKEPLVRQPCSLAFDARGRLYVGMGPQYRHPKPDTPGDSVVIISDADGDGVAEKAKVFATGFNCVQGLAWHGRDLWVANAPDLTIVRDLDGDDEADEYVRLYTDLGNLEHGLHGLCWAPDGKLYMSKGNSKGLTKPGRLAPRPFRELWGVAAPPDSPDFPAPLTYKKGEYRLTYHDPADDWGREGGVLRCDDGGRNLEIVSRGMRNPWDINLDSGFHWLGTDNDQVEGDRVFTPFFGAHFGWNHPWSSHWTDEPHAPTAPVSGPLFEGSGTGVVFCESSQFPPAYRGVFFINDWLQRTTFVWQPTWDGALMKPAEENWTPFIQAGNSLFRPTDIEIGPDGALWILGWSSGYGAEWDKGELTNQGRIFRVAWKEAEPAKWNSAKRARPLAEWSVAELIEDFGGPLPVWRIDAQDELVRRDAKVKADLVSAIKGDKLSQAQETWAAWALGRIAPRDPAIAEFFAQALVPDSRAGFNLRLQALRILAYRVRQQGVEKALPASAVAMLRSAEPRLRHAAVEAVVQARQKAQVSALLEMMASETDPVVFYAAWQGLRELLGPAELQPLLADKRGGVRRGALLALLETGGLARASVTPLAEDVDPLTREVASLWLHGKPSKNSKPRPPGRLVPTPELSLVNNLQAQSGRKYQSLPLGLAPDAKPYTDRDYTLKQVPQALLGAELIQTANDDDGSRDNAWLTFDAVLPVRIHVGLDARTPRVPTWLREGFQLSVEKILADHWTFQLYAREFPAGRVELGGNTDDGQSGGKGNYVVILEPLPLPKQASPATTEQALALLAKGDLRRGELLFKHQGAAGCAKCHSLGERKNAFGPQLADIGRRATPKHVVESILEPSAHITEGFSRLQVETTDGRVHAGVLLEESGVSLKLGLETGEALVIDKQEIESRTTTKQSAMPSLAPVLTPQQAADIAVFLLAQQGKDPAAPPAAPKPPAAARGPGFAIELKDDRLSISHSGRPVGDFVFKDPKIPRPYFANLHVPGGAKVTRNHPPVSGQDATDHDTMHPGIWLGFGDLSGSDFWRHHGRIEHVRFVEEPKIDKERLTFASLCRLLTSKGDPLCTLTSRFTLVARPAGWLLVWDATFHSDDRDFTFGDQEEMGFGARLATGLTEKEGGTILNSHGDKSAKETWGKPAAWCDYFAEKDGRRRGILLMPSPKNFRESWWHNRDYGVFVANPFGRSAMRQGSKSEVTVKRGESFRLVFGALLHDAAEFDPAGEFKHFGELVK